MKVLLTEVGLPGLPPASRVYFTRVASAQSVQCAGLPPQQPQGSSNLHPYDPEHLVVNGLGGAFLHPTHVFAAARFASNPEPPEDDVFVRGVSPPRGRSPKGSSPRSDSAKGSSPRSSRGASPSSRRSRNTRRGSFTGTCGQPNAACSLQHGPTLALRKEAICLYSTRKSLLHVWRHLSATTLVLAQDFGEMSPFGWCRRVPLCVIAWFAWLLLLPGATPI